MVPVGERDPSSNRTDTWVDIMTLIGQIKRQQRLNTWLLTIVTLLTMVLCFMVFTR
jgi:hypothetical protein